MKLEVGNTFNGWEIIGIQAIAVDSEGNTLPVLSEEKANGFLIKFSKFFPITKAGSLTSVRKAIALVRISKSFLTDVSSDLLYSFIEKSLNKEEEKLLSKDISN